MPGPQEMATLIDRLGAASLEAKELLREVRGAIGDMRQAERDAHRAKAEVTAAVAEAITANVEEMIRARVVAELDDTGKQIQQFTERLYDGIIENVNKLTDALLGAPNTDEDLRPLIERRAGIITGRDHMGTLPRMVYRGPKAINPEDKVVGG